MARNSQESMHQHQGSRKDRKKKSSGSDPMVNWMVRVVISFFGAVLSFIFLPRLQFSFEIDIGVRMFYSCGIFLLLLWGTSAAFQKQKTWLTWLLFIALGIALLANLSLQFKWVESNDLIRFLATMLILPAGVVWACLLSKTSFDDQHSVAKTPFTAAFSKPVVFISAVVVFGVGCFLIFYKLGLYDFWEDEGLAMKAAIGLRDEGFQYLKSGYDRAWIHSWLVSQSIQLFGESEWSARLPSAVFGLLFIGSSFYIFFKWFGWPWLGIMVPLVCILTDEFLILFRYTRMYALLIPLFLSGMYLCFYFLTKERDKPKIVWRNLEVLRFNIYTGVAAVIIMLLAFHIHSLAAVGFLASLVMVLSLWLTTKQKKYRDLIFLFLGFGALCFLLALVGVDFFRSIPNAIRRLVREDEPEFNYYTYLFNNGLATNISLMTFIGGLGLLFNTYWAPIRRQALGFCYIIVGLALMFMVYLMADEGRDFRYISHIVPFVICIQWIVLFSSSALLPGKMWPRILVLIPLLYSVFTFSKEYKEVYIKHPWAPSYSTVYLDVKNKYVPGEAIFYQNMKTYYLDPEMLAGAKAIKMGRLKEYTLEQFKKDLADQPAAWVIFDTHKSYHIDPAILKYLPKKFSKLHGSGVDDAGVEVYHLIQE